MKCLTFAATLASLCAALGAARADITVLDNDKTLEVDCAKDPQVGLAGNHITLTLKGICAMILVDGNEATIRGSAAAVRINGNHNTATLDAADQVVAPVSVRRGGQPQILQHREPREEVGALEGAPHPAAG